MRAARVAVLVLLALAGAACGERAAKVEGRYVSAGATAATLGIARDGERYVVTLAGGSPRDAGAAAPADCQVRAIGTLRDGVLDATFSAIDTTTMSYGEAKARREGRQLRLAVQANTIEVTRADVDGYCGLGASFVGVYRRAS
jgi:hypothetical protein